MAGLCGAGRCVHALHRLSLDVDFKLAAIPQFVGTNTTGAGSASLGANCPAVTPTAPYTWIQVKTADGSTAYFPVWK